MQIGFIGLGNLGTPIAENLLAGAGGIRVYNRTLSKAEPLVAKGAQLCHSVKEIASACDIIFTIVADDQALREITEGPGGIAANLKRGAFHISISTVLPQTAIDLDTLHKKYGNHYLASPVMGRPEAARASKLNFLVSGKKEIIEQARPFLHMAGGAAIWEFGEQPAAANVAKLCNNFLIISAIEAMAEGMQLAKKSGIDPAAWLNMLTQTFFSAPIYVNYGNILLKENFLPPGFSLKLGLKDVNLVMGQARSAGAKMPIGNALQTQLSKSVEMGLGEHDWTAVALALK
jgi:3-hydroxyisobutyrate dehydrogenase-like beta-hydroxyacid dehydrogenase